MEPWEYLHLGNELKQEPPKKTEKKNTREEPEHKELHVTKNTASRRRE